MHFSQWHVLCMHNHHVANRRHVMCACLDGMLSVLFLSVICCVLSDDMMPSPFTSRCVAQFCALRFVCANADHKSVMESVFYTMNCLGNRCD